MLLTCILVGKIDINDCLPGRSRQCMLVMRVSPSIEVTDMTECTRCMYDMHTFGLHMES